MESNLVANFKTGPIFFDYELCIIYIYSIHPHLWPSGHWCAKVSYKYKLMLSLNQSEIHYPLMEILPLPWYLNLALHINITLFSMHCTALFLIFSVAQTQSLSYPSSWAQVYKVVNVKLCISVTRSSERGREGETERGEGRQLVVASVTRRKLMIVLVLVHTHTHTHTHIHTGTQRDGVGVQRGKKCICWLLGPRS